MPNFSWEFINEIMHDLKRIQIYNIDIVNRVRISNGMIKDVEDKINSKILEEEKENA